MTANTSETHSQQFSFHRYNSSTDICAASHCIWNVCVCVVLLIERKSASNNCDCHERNVQIIGANTQKHTVCSSEIQSIECVHLKRSQINWVELHPFDCKRVAKCWTLRVAMKQQNVDKLPNKSNKFAVILPKISGTGFVCLFSRICFSITMGNI